MSKKKLLIIIIIIIILISIIIAGVMFYNFWNIKNIKMNRHISVANNVKEIDFEGLKIKLNKSDLFEKNEIAESDLLANIDFSLIDNKDFGEFSFEYIICDSSNNIISASMPFFKDDEKRANVVKHFMYNYMHTQKYLRYGQDLKGMSAPINLDIYNNQVKNFNIIAKNTDKEKIETKGNIHILLTNIRYNVAGEQIKDLYNEIFEFEIEK